MCFWRGTRNIVGIKKNLSSIINNGLFWTQYKTLGVLRLSASHSYVLLYQKFIICVFLQLLYYNPYNTDEFFCQRRTLFLLRWHVIAILLACICHGWGWHTDQWLLCHHISSSQLSVGCSICKGADWFNNNVPCIKTVLLWVIYQSLLFSSISIYDIDMTIFFLTWLHIGVTRLTVLVSYGFSLQHPPNKLHRDQVQSTQQKLWDFSMGLMHSCSSLFSLRSLALGEASCYVVRTLN